MTNTLGGETPRTGDVGWRVGKTPGHRAGRPAFWAQMPPCPVIQSATGNSVGAIPPFLAQVVPLSGENGRGNLRSSHRDVPQISSPPGGANLVQCLAYLRCRVLMADFTRTRQESPCRAGGPGTGRTTRCAPARPPKKLFPPFHTYIVGGQLLVGVMLLE